MLQVDVVARVRHNFGKGAARTLRRAGKTPAVLYGPALAPLALELETKPLTKALLAIHRHNAIINLDVDDGKAVSKRHVMVKEIQTDPVQDNVIHADFLEVSLEKPMTFIVPLVFKGKPKGVDMGGDMVVGKTEVVLKGKALDIPDCIQVDVSPLELGATLKCGDLNIPASVTLQDPAGKVCVSVIGAAE